MNVSEGRKVCVFHRYSGFRHSPQHGTGHKAEQCGQDTIIQMSVTDGVQYTLTLSESNSGQYLTPLNGLVRLTEGGLKVEVKSMCECEECVSACRLWRALLVWCC